MICSQRMIAIWTLIASLTIPGLAPCQTPKPRRQPTASSRRDYVAVPLTFDSNRYPQVQVEIEGVSMLLEIDSGAASSSIDRPAADRAGLSGDSKGTVVTGNQSIDLERVKVKRISIGGMSSGCVANIVDYSAANARRKDNGDPTVDGILGADYLAAHAAVIDYGRAKLRLWASPAEAKSLPKEFQTDRTVEIPLVENKDRCFNVNVRVDGIKMNFALDTGANAMFIDPKSAQRAKLSLQKTGLKSFNHAGEQEVSRTRIGDFAIGSIHGYAYAYTKPFDALNALNKKRGDAAIDGLLDTNFLRKHGAIIDFGAKRLFLRPDVAESKNGEKD